MPLEARLKSLESIEEKVRRKNIELENVDHLDDFIGLRLILLFRGDLKRVGEVIKEAFEVVSYEDTSTRLTESQFGYQSDHYVIRIRQEWEKVPTYRGLSHLKAEVQVRTMAQHVWAAASHKLQYKQEENIPFPLRRSINRVSALLETVDLEFERLNGERLDYIESIDIKPDVQLDVDVVAKLLAELWPAKNLQPEDEEYNSLVSELRHFGIASSHGLRKLVLAVREEILHEEAQLLHRLSVQEGLEGHYAKMVEGGYYFTQVALTRIALRRKFGDEEVNQVIRCGGGRTRKTSGVRSRPKRARRKSLN
jgi:ppGpp synthetase/RelA/SpoT-type nucleotidyltranferase